MLSSCSFTTERLVVREWHSAIADVRPACELALVVAAMLTDAVTRSLPREWHGPYSPARAREWIAERDAEGTTLLAVGRGSGRPLGLLLLAEADPGDGGRREMRLGYLVSQKAWGSGVATELVRSFVGWCRAQRPAASIAAVVDPGNAASARVLQKAGFDRVPEGDASGGGEHHYRLRP